MRRRFDLCADSTYRSQSTANSSDISEVGRPSADSTSSIVMRAALGMDAAPTLANVAVKLQKRHCIIIS
jgi:hypothetical protein